MFTISANSAFKKYDFLTHKTEYSDYLDKKYNNIKLPDFKIKVINGKLKIINGNFKTKKTILNINTISRLPFKKTNVRMIKIKKFTNQELFTKLYLFHLTNIFVFNHLFK